MSEIFTPEELERRLREIGDERYHNLHPFHKMLHDGKMNFGQVQAWALNRYVYQAAIPRKDAALMAKVCDRELRREWIRRIHDHDGYGSEAGGIERWLKLTDGLKLDRVYVTSQAGALPATKFAVEAYVHFVYEHPTLEAIASSLTELLAPGIHAERIGIAGMLEHYDFISEELVAKRLDQAPRDSQFALTFVLENARTSEEQQAVLNALKFKTDVLWAQLDALYFAYVDPGFIPPGAFRPE